MKINLQSESATPLLYHITSTFAAAKIVKSDRFELKPSDGTEAEEQMNGKGAYYLSCTRSKVGAYSLMKLWETSAIFVLDGTKMASNFKIKPVNYWGHNEQQTPGERTKQDEAEDRVLSNKPTFSAKRFVLEVHAHIGRSGDRERNWSVALKRACLLAKIPVWFYDDKQALLLMNKVRAVPLNIRDHVAEDAPYVHERTYKEAQYNERRQNLLSGWIEAAMYPLHTVDRDAIYEISKTKLSKYANMVYKRLQYAYNDDALRALQCDMHNAKSKPYDTISGERESLDKLIALLRKRKQSVKEFIKALELKWYPPRKER